MDKSLIGIQTNKVKKNDRRYFGVLQRLAKFDTSILNIMKVKVYKEDITEETEHILIAPSICMKYPELSISFNSTENIIENIVEDSIIGNKNSKSSNPELMNYRDSSDFSDDED